MLCSAKIREKKVEKEQSKSEGVISSTTFRDQSLYLFDIVASLCAGFNEHDIQFLSSLLALLRGDLSAQVEAEGGRGVDERIDIERQRKEERPKRRGERNKQSSTQNLILRRKERG